MMQVKGAHFCSIHLHFIFLYDELLNDFSTAMLQKDSTFDMCFKAPNQALSIDCHKQN